MARKMRCNNSGQVVTVHSHGITRNFWEYYILDKRKTDYRLALVEGFVQELGDISMSEIKPYLIGFTSDLDEVMPAPGWTWVE